MSGPTTVDDVVLGAFPHPTLPPIQGRPTYDSLVELRRLLRANAASIPCLLGGGAHGYTALTLSPARYYTLTGHNFNIPANPGVHPVIPVNATQHQITQANRQHKADVKEFQTYTAVQGALKKQILAAIEDIYLSAIKDPILGYANRTTMDMLDHLFNNYAQLTPTELADNMMIHLVKPWDPSTPFETVINQIERCTEFADDGGAPIPAQIILNTAYTLVFNSGAYFDDIRDWERMSSK